MKVEKCRRLKVNKKRELFYGGCVIVLILFAFLSFFMGRKDNHLHLYFLDVGQGDAMVFEEPGYVFIVDGGGSHHMDEANNTGKKILLPFLLKKNIQKIDCAFISHMHYDHVKGIMELLQLIPVRSIVLSEVYKELYADKTSENGETMALLKELFSLCETYGTKVLFMKEGDTLRGNRLSFTCIYPFRESLPEKEENGNSLVMYLKADGVRALLTGDIENEGEKRILEEKRGGGKQTSIDLLKVAHHGSDTSSSTAFIEKINPKDAIVSVGKNSFGHPSPSVVKRFSNMNIALYSTKNYGMIEVIVQKNTYVIESFKGELHIERTASAFKE